MDKSRDNPGHPANDPDFLNRRRPNPENPANNPDFLFELLDRMDKEPGVREAVWESFYQGDVSFLLHDTQLDIKRIIDRDDVNEFLIFCSRQLGKSFVILVLAVEHCAKPHGRRAPLVRIFCETTSQVEDIVNDNMQLIMSLAPPGWIKRMKSENRWKIGVGELRLGPIAAAHVDGKRGGNATMVIIEEAVGSKSETYARAIGKVINPQLLRSRGKLVHVTTPPEDINHYVVAEVMPKCKAAGAYARHTVYDNVQLSDEQIIEAFERCVDVDDWRREYLVQVLKSKTRTVIPDFDEDSHVRAAPLPKFAFWDTSLDFGGVRDKHGIVLGYWDFRRSKLVVEDEVFLDINTATPQIKERTEAMEARVAAELQAFGAKLWIQDAPRRVSDCPGQIRVDLSALGFYTRTPEKEPGSWEAGISELRRGFQNDEIEINPRCVWLIHTLDYGLYTVNRKDWERTPALGHLDLLAALIYLWRHRTTVNPFPRRHGKSKVSNYIPSDEQDPPDALNDAFAS